MSKAAWLVAIAAALMLGWTGPVAAAHAQAGLVDPEIVYVEQRWVGGEPLTPRLMVCNGDGSNRVEIFESSDVAYRPRMAPDRRSIVFQRLNASDDSSAVLRTRFEVADNVLQVLDTETLVPAGGQYKGRIALPPNGAKVAYYDIRAKALKEYSFATRKAKTIYKSPKGWSFELVGGYSAGGAALYFTERKRDDMVVIKRLEFLTRGRVRVVTLLPWPGKPRLLFVEPSKIGNQLAVWQEDQERWDTTYVLDLDSRSVDEILPRGGDRSPSWSPDDSMLLYYDGGNTLMTIELSSGRVTRLFDEAMWPDWR